MSEVIAVSRNRVIALPVATRAAASQLRDAYDRLARFERHSGSKLNSLRTWFKRVASSMGPFMKNKDMAVSVSLAR